MNNIHQQQQHPTIEVENHLFQLEATNQSCESLIATHKKLYVNARIQTPKLQLNSHQRRTNALHITVCQDLSSSVSGEKLKMCQKAINFIISNLTSIDRFGLVTFGARVRENVPLVEMTPQGKESARRSIYELEDQVGGNSALGWGLMSALKQMPWIVPPHVVNTAFGYGFGANNKNTNNNNYNNNNAHSSWSANWGAPAAATKKQEPVAAASPISVVISHTLNREKAIYNSIYDYTLTIKPPADCTEYSITIFDPLTKDATSLTMSGEMEMQLPPTHKAIEKVALTFFFAENKKNSSSGEGDGQSFATVEYQPGEVSMKKQTLNLTPIRAANDGGSAKKEEPLVATSVTRVILLFSDGGAKGWSGTTPAQLKRDVQQFVSHYPKTVQANANEEPLPTSSPLIFSFGFGIDNDASLLRDLAQLTQSAYYTVEHVKFIPRVFADVLGSLMAVVARNVRLEIRPQSNKVSQIVKVWSGGFAQQQQQDTDEQSNRPYPTKLSTTGATQIAKQHYTVNLNTLFEQETKDILVEVTLQEAVLQNPMYPLVFTLCYDHVPLGIPNVRKEVFSIINVVPTARYVAVLESPKPVSLGGGRAFSLQPQQASSSIAANTNNFVLALLNRFQTQETFEDIRQLAERGVMEQAQEVAIKMCERLQQALEENEMREEQDQQPQQPQQSQTDGSSAAAASSSASRQPSPRRRKLKSQLEACLAQATDVASSGMISRASYEYQGGRVRLNLYSSELALQRNNRVAGPADSNGTEARSVFADDEDLSDVRKMMRRKIQEE